MTALTLHDNTIVVAWTTGGLLVVLLVNCDEAGLLSAHSSVAPHVQYICIMQAKHSPALVTYHD